ncbi:MAG: hypothetical protein AAGJ19_13790 [Myxococcota bacterium]
MAEKTIKRALWLGPEANYGVDPGSYLSVPLKSPSDITEGRVVIETNRTTGRTAATDSIPGPNSASLSGSVEVLGLTAQAGDGVAPGARDYFDEILRGILGIEEAFDGQAVSTHSGTSLDLGAGAPAYAAGDIVILQDAGGNVVPAIIAADLGGGSFTLVSDPGITATVALGCRAFRDDDGTDQSQTFYGVFAEDSGLYNLPGIRFTSATLNAVPTDSAMLALEMAADESPASTKTGLPAQSGATPSTPLRLATVYADGVAVPTSSVEVNFGLQTAPLASTARPNGRSNHLLVRMAPMITIIPLITEAQRQLRQQQTVRSLLVHLGGARGLTIAAGRCQVTDDSRVDESGVLRYSQTYTVRDSGSAYPQIQAVRH